MAHFVTLKSSTQLFGWFSSTFVSMFLKFSSLLPKHFNLCLGFSHKHFDCSFIGLSFQKSFPFVMFKKSSSPPPSFFFAFYPFLPLSAPSTPPLPLRPPLSFMNTKSALVRCTILSVRPFPFQLVWATHNLNAFQTFIQTKKPNNVRFALITQRIGRPFPFGFMIENVDQKLQNLFSSNQSINLDFQNFSVISRFIKNLHPTLL